MINSSWIKRRWLDFRSGHSIYLVFAMGFFQFTIITYTLAIERLPLLTELFPSMSYWIAFFISIYIPCAVIIGHQHLRKQKPIEDRQNADNNPFTYETSPGKEQLYSLPATRRGYELQLKAMEMTNRQADIFSEIYQRPFPKYSKEEFQQVQYYLEVTIRLQKGENITDIIKVLGSAP